LDELLQALRISVSASDIRIDVRLTPGVALAQTIFHRLDADGDGLVSESEANAFASAWLGKLTATVDQDPIQFHTTRITAPSWQELSSGDGSLTIELRSGALALARGHHQLQIRNDNDPQISVYLVNAVLPATSDVIVGAQNRNESQSAYRLDFETGRGLFSDPIDRLVLVAVLASFFWALDWGLHRRDRNRSSDFRR
jgi:hypothetical protein